MKFRKKKFGRAKKAEIKIIESIGIMIVFFFILIIGMIFYSRLSSVAYEQKKQENLDKQAINIALLAGYMSELQCNIGDVGETNQNCIDIQKVNAFMNISEEAKDNYYQGLFQYATISIFEIFPDKGEVQKVYDNPIPAAKTVINTLIPVSLYDPASKSYAYGMLSVDTYCCVQK